MFRPFLKKGRNLIKLLSEHLIFKFPKIKVLLLRAILFNILERLLVIWVHNNLFERSLFFMVETDDGLFVELGEMQNVSNLFPEVFYWLLKLG